VRAARDAEASAGWLRFHSARDGYRLLHSRQWHVVDDRQNLVALRLLQRGELIAQCNISPGKPLESGKPWTLETYQEEVQKTLDKRFRKIVSAEEKTSRTGLKLLTVVAEGEWQEVPVRWVYYLLTHKSGKQVGLVFTLEAKAVERFGLAAEELVSGLVIDDPTAGNAAPRDSKTR